MSWLLTKPPPPGSVVSDSGKPFVENKNLRNPNGVTDSQSPILPSSTKGISSGRTDLIPTSLVDGHFSSVVSSSGRLSSGNGQSSEQFSALTASTSHCCSGSEPGDPGGEGESKARVVERSRTLVDLRGVRRRLLVSRLALLKGKKGRMALPPAIEITPRVRQTYRFIVNGNQSLVGITYGDVLGVAGGICTVANSSLRLVATSARVYSIAIWPVINTAGSNANSTEISWVGANADQAPDFAYNEVLPAGTTIPSAVRTRPPAKSLASDWFNNAVTLTDVLFQLTCGQGSVLDLDLEITFPNTLLSSAVTIATGTLGVFYYLTLNHSGTKNIFPSTLPNTT